ncbi:hypothetical protein NKH14_32255 [Mesorhizobium sp. M1380]|uniref:hypothetical protein n=1 Tax=Mesorhizobium sp. M1380 TaxID=2957093 RepID=UPI00333975D7
MKAKGGWFVSPVGYPTLRGNLAPAADLHVAALLPVGLIGQLRIRKISSKSKQSNNLGTVACKTALAISARRGPH